MRHRGRKGESDASMRKNYLDSSPVQGLFTRATRLTERGFSGIMPVSPRQTAICCCRDLGKVGRSITADRPSTPSVGSP
jgi:hypothetical protein